MRKIHLTKKIILTVFHNADIMIWRAKTRHIFLCVKAEVYSNQQINITGGEKNANI